MTDTSPLQQQLSYYREAAEGYGADYPEHIEAISYVIAFLRGLGAGSVLDTGCGTDFAMRNLAAVMPELAVRGNDPSPDLLRVAKDRFGVDPSLLDCVSSESLPYADGSFDAVVETGMLHHIPDPGRVVDEMLRVARMAVFISDENAYGNGAPARRLMKLVLSRSGHLRTVLRWSRGGREWYTTEGDAPAWTYSVFDSTPQLAKSCPTVLVIPLGQQRYRDKWPLLCASHCLVAGFKAPYADLVLGDSISL